MPIGSIAAPRASASDQRPDVEGVAGKDHEIEIRRRAEQPVELRQRVMQIGHDEAAHIDFVQMLKEWAKPEKLYSNDLDGANFVPYPAGRDRFQQGIVDANCPDRHPLFGKQRRTAGR